MCSGSLMSGQVTSKPSVSFGNHLQVYLLFFALRRSETHCPAQNYLLIRTIQYMRGVPNITLLSLQLVMEYCLGSASDIVEGIFYLP